MAQFPRNWAVPLAMVMDDVDCPPMTGSFMTPQGCCGWAKSSIIMMEPSLLLFSSIRVKSLEDAAVVVAVASEARRAHKNSKTKRPAMNVNDDDDDDDDDDIMVLLRLC